MSEYNRNEEHTLVINEKTETFTHPVTGEQVPFYYKLTQEQEDRIVAMADSLVTACEELSIPVLIVLQTSNTPDAGDIVRRGSLPGPRCGRMMNIFSSVIDRLEQN